MPPPREDWFEAERLIRAAQDGDIAEAERLVAAGYDVNLMDDISKGALHYAVEREHYRFAEWLLKNGADVNLHDPEMIGETPLAVAAQGDYPEIVDLLLKCGADPDIQGWMQQTARSRARKRKDMEGEQISALIERHRPSTPSPRGARR